MKNWSLNFATGFGGEYIHTLQENTEITGLIDEIYYFFFWKPLAFRFLFSEKHGNSYAAVGSEIREHLAALKIASAIGIQKAKMLKKESRSSVNLLARAGLPMCFK